VRLELPGGDGDPYQAAAKTLREWLNRGTLVRDEAPAFYVYQQEFRYGGETRRRRTLFGRLRLEPWDQGTVLPHEQTFRAPKEDRSRLLQSLRLNTSPVFLVYPDSQQQVAPLVARAVSDRATVEFADDEGLSHALWRIDDPHLAAAIAHSLARERLYVADGHHRYETALAYRDEQLAGSGAVRSGDEPEEFVLAALVAADDPGLLVLPIHRLVDVDVPAEAAVAEVRRGRARYGLLLNPVSPRRILAVADAGERMPQKSTFFYPKLPTGLLFYPLFAPE
jgi:uncharacterized protein (DUF1015 family)